MKEISFIHTADLHLDSPFKGLTKLPRDIFEDVRQSTFRAFDKLISLAIKEMVDFILITGDLFDHEHYSLKAQIHLRDAFNELDKYGIKVYLLYGNHDFINHDRQTVAFPSNVFVFENKEVNSFLFKKYGEPMVKITGFSYEKRAVKEEKVIEYPRKDNEVPFHIGMLHGSLYGDKEHDTYAPFQLQQLRDKHYNYWALGHIHKRAVLDEQTPIIYPGNIQGRHRKETGEKGCYLVHLSESDCHYSFIPLQMIQFSNLTINLKDFQTIENLETHVQKILFDYDGVHTLHHLTWLEAMSSQTESHLQELVDIVNNRFLKQTPWQYIYRTKIKESSSNDSIIHTTFMKEISTALDHINVQHEIKELTQHTEARNFLELSEEKELISNTEQLLAKLLQRNEDYS